MEEDNDTDNSESSGYKKPPKSGQFPPGVSGNPDGRPPNKKSPKRAFKEFLFEKVAVKKENRRRKMTRIEIIIRVIQKEAAAGNVRAKKILDGWISYIPEALQENRIPTVTEEYGKGVIFETEFYNFLKKYNISKPDFEQRYEEHQAEIAQAKKDLGWS